MKKKPLEIIVSVGCVAVFIILIAAAKLIVPAASGFGYTAALLIFVVIMGMAGLKLAEIPDE
jgi:hypothetical protein